VSESDYFSPTNLALISGANKAYDQAEETHRKLLDSAEEYRKDQCRHFGAEIHFFGNGSNAYQLEVPEAK